MLHRLASLYLSKCHIVGNHMSRLICLKWVKLCIQWIISCVDPGNSIRELLIIFLVINTFQKGPYEPPSRSMRLFLPVFLRKPIVTCDLPRGVGGSEPRHPPLDPLMHFKYASLCLFVLFDLILYIPSTIFQLNRDGSSWVEPVLS